MYVHYIPRLSAESHSLDGLAMSQRPPRDPRLPPRASRHRSSVIGPPPGIEAGTGYISPQTSPTEHQFPRPPPRSRPPTAPIIPVTSGSSTTFRRNAQRPDPDIFDPIIEEPPTPPARSWRRPRQRDTESSDAPTVMFYPSGTTMSSIESSGPAEPMPFFRTDLRMPTSSTGSIPSNPEEARPSRGETLSTASSGVLGGGTMVDVDPDTENDSDGESTTTSSSSFNQLERSVSLVRRGQARIVRNPSARRSVVPEVLETRAPASSSRTPTPPDMPLPEPPRSVRRSRLGATSPPPVQLRQLSPVPLQPRAPSSVYSTTSGGLGRPPVSPGRGSPRYLGSAPSLFPRTTPSPAPLPRTSPSPSPPSSTVSSDFSSSSRNTERGRARPRPPPLNMAAVAEGQNRGSLTSLPDLLDRATRLHDVLSAGRTASVLNSGFPGRDSRTPTEASTSQPGFGDMLASFPPPATTVPRNSTPSGLRTSWPLFNIPIGRSQVPQQIHSPLRQTRLGRGIVSERTMNTPSPPAERGFFRSFFSKYDPGDKIATGPLYTTRFDDGNGGDRERRRRCCGIPVWTFLMLSVLLIIIIIAAIVTPIAIIRGRKHTTSELSVATCQNQKPCQNGGVSYVGGDPPQCACVCASGFNGPQCQTVDSSCVTFKGDNVNDTAIGSSIDALLQVAPDFSSQFKLNAERIVEQFAASNVSCTSQDSLVNLNGSTSAVFSVSQSNSSQRQEEVVVFEAWTTTTRTTTVMLTFTTTIPFVTTSESTSWTSYCTTATTTTVTSGIPTSTYSLATSTIPTPSATPLSEENLVFGRCVILAVVQDLGVSTAAEVQQLLETAIEHGTSVVQDSALGLTIDLSAETVSGLPN